MKVYTTLFYLMIVISGYGQSSSVLSKGNWYKFSISTTGVYKLDANFLKKLGINTKSVDPKNIKIFGNGGSMLPEKLSLSRFNGLKENSIYIKGEEDRSFDNDDYILFYGKGAHDWRIDIATRKANHNQNIYSDKSYYFLTIDTTPGRRIQILEHPNQNSTKTFS